MTPEVSVVVPTRNRSAMLRRTVSTILDQRGVDIEVIAVDEASEDDTVSMLHALGDPRVRVVRHESARGVSAARNSGATHATAPWIAFCDDDDMWAPDKLTAQLHALAESPGADWCGCGAVWVDTGLNLLRALEPPPAGDVADLVLAFNALPGSASAIMLRTAALRQVGEFDSSLRWGEDWEMWTRFALRSPVATVDRPLVAYLVHDRNMSSHSPDFDREVAIIDQRYRAERSSRGVRLDRVHLKGAQAEIELKAGRRFSAAREYGKQFMSGGGVGSLKRGVGAILVPDLVKRRWSEGRRGDIPAAWEREVETWLEPLRQAGTAA